MINNNITCMKRNNLFTRTLLSQSLLSQSFPKRVYAHCDVPCGVYSPHHAQIAAKTVETMVAKLHELKTPSPELELKTVLAFHNSVTRMVMTKEKHAQICKNELLILWTDYFKREHLTTFPDLHDTFWNATKLCSKNKQEVNLSSAKELVSQVNHISEMFHQAEAMKK